MRKTTVRLELSVRMAILAIMVDGTVLVSFVTNQSHLRGGNLSKEWPLSDRHVGMVVGAFSWLVIDLGGPSPLWAGPLLGRGPRIVKKTNCHVEQAY